MFTFVFLAVFAAWWLYWRYCRQEELNVKGKVIVCIGSSSGLGNAFVVRCLQEGANVFAGCQSPAGAEKLKAQCAGLKGILHPLVVDVASKESVQDAFDYVTAASPQGIDALVNNAGICVLGQDDWLCPEDYDFIWRVNTLGLIRVTQVFKPLLKASKGRVVMVSSVLGRLTLPAFGTYCVSKHALESYSDLIRRELSHFGVQVAIVEPGFFRTPLTTPENSIALFGSAWERASKEAREEYGEEFLQRQTNLFVKFLSSPLNSPRVDRVVDAYLHAALAKQPKTRYVVGMDARLIWIPFSLMPHWMQDALLLVTQKMLCLPLPAAIAGSNSKESAD